MDTTIEWTQGDDGTPGKTWNPARGCARVSPGCENCYAERMAGRFCAPGQPYEGLARRGPNGARWTGEVRLVPERLADPLKWKRPRRVFVNSMSDLFHEQLSDDEIDRVFGVMHACEYGRDGSEGHVFQVLTKRSARMRDYLSQDRRGRWAHYAAFYGGGIDPDGIHDQVRFRKGPHPRIWLGVSVEDQARADERIPHLLETPAAVRFLSVEPMLGPVDLRSWLGLRCSGCGIHGDDQTVEWCQIGSTYWEGHAVPGSSPDVCGPFKPIGGGYRKIDWVICGAESGPGARPMREDWVRSLRDQCTAAGVPFFYKQRLEHGRKVSLPLLDGKRWQQWPEARP